MLILKLPAFCRNPNYLEVYEVSKKAVNKQRKQKMEFWKTFTWNVQLFIFIFKYSENIPFFGPSSSATDIIS